MGNKSYLDLLGIDREKFAEWEEHQRGMNKRDGEYKKAIREFKANYIPDVTKIGENISPTSETTKNKTVKTTETKKKSKKKERNLGNVLHDFFIGGADENGNDKFFKLFGAEVKNNSAVKTQKIEKEKQDKVSNYINQYGYLDKNASDDDKFNYYKNYFDTTGQSKSDEDIKKMLGFGGSITNSENRVISSAKNAMAPGFDTDYQELAKANSQYNGSKFGNVATNLLGNTLGMAVNPGGTFMPGQNSLNVTDDIAKNIANKTVKNKVGKEVTRLGVDGALGGALDTFKEQNADNLGKNIIEGATGNVIFGGAFDLGAKGINKGLNNLDTKLGKNVNNLFDDVENSVKGIDKNTSDYVSKVKFVNKSQLPNVTNKTEIPKIPNIKTDVDVNRDFWDISNVGGKKKVSLISDEMPELKPFIKQQAEYTIGELDQTVRRNGTFNDLTSDPNYVIGDKTGNSTYHDTITSDTVEIIKAQTGKSYKEIRQGLEDLINGKNTALTRKIELILDDNLKNGYEAGVFTRDTIEPNKDYLEMINLYSQLNKGDMSSFMPQADVSNIKLTEQSIPQTKKNLSQGQINATDDIAVSKLEKEKLSRHANITAMDSINVSDEVKNLIPTKEMTYEPVTFQGEYDKAINEINNNPDAFIDFLNGKYKHSQNTAIGEALFKKFESEGDYDKALTVMSKLTTNLSKSGQEVAMARLLNSTTPGGRVKLAVQQVSKATDEVLTKNKKLNTKVENDITTITNELNNKNKSSAEKKEILNNILTSKNASKKTQVDKLIKLSNSGTLKNDDVRNAVLEKYGLGSIDAEDTKKIIELTKSLDNAKTTREQEVINAQIRKIINDKIPATFMDKVDSFRFINMLLNPKTLIKNFAGNVVNVTAGQGRNVLANQIDNIASKFTGQKAVYNPNTKLFTGMKDGFKNVLEDHKLGIDTSYGTKEGVVSSAFKDSKTPIGKLMNKSEKLLSTGLKMGDVPFSKGLEEQYIYGYMKNNNINDIKDVPMEILEEARQIGKEGTYQQDSRLANWINKGNDMPGVKFLMNAVNPFVKTPINIAKTAIDYSPFGIGKGIKNYIDLATGNTDNALRSQRKGAEQIASGLMGSGLLGAGVLASQNGMATPNIDQDRDKRKFENQTGKLPYSLNIGGKNIGLEFMQPLSTSFMIGSDLGKGENDIMRLINTGINSFANNSFMSGFTDLAQNISYNGIGGALTGATENYAKQLLPFNSLANSINKSIDNKQRETYSDSALGSLGNQAMAKYPILSQMLPQKVDTLGQPMTYNDDTGMIGNILRNTIIPTNVAGDVTSEQENIINKLYQDTGSKAVFPYATIGKDFEFRVGLNGTPQQVQLTQDEYINYSKLVGQYINDNIRDWYTEKDMTDLIADAKAMAKDKILQDRGYTKNKVKNKVYYTK